MYGKSEDYDIWSFDNTFFERILTASHPSVTGYCLNEAQVYPQFKEYILENESYEMIRPIQERMIKSFRDIMHIFDSSAFDAEDFYGGIMKNHIQVSLGYTVDKAKFQQKLYENQVDNFSTGKSMHDINKNIFGVKQVIRKLFTHLNIIKNTPIMIKIFAQNKLYILIPLIAAIRKKNMLKTIRRRT